MTSSEGEFIFTTRPFKRGDFLLQYKGRFMDVKEAERKEEEYTEEMGSYMFYFQWEGKTHCIDATFSHGLGRLVNDIQPAMANCQMRKILTGEEVYLCLFAIKNIPAGTELRYDYGISDLPWRKTGTIPDEINDITRKSADQKGNSKENTGEKVLSTSSSEDGQDDDKEPVNEITSNADHDLNEEPVIKKRRKRVSGKVLSTLSLEDDQDDGKEPVNAKNGITSLADDDLNEQPVIKERRKRESKITSDSDDDVNEEPVSKKRRKRVSGKVLLTLSSEDDQDDDKEPVNEITSNADDDLNEEPVIKKRRKRVSEKVLPTLSSEDDQDDDKEPVNELTSKDDKCSDDKKKRNEMKSSVQISTAKKTEHNTRIYDKKQACYYCKNTYSKIARHYINVHSKEKQVTKALSHDKSSKLRKKELEKLRLLGNYHHNIQVLETRCGHLLVMRRPSDFEETKPEDFLPCSYCFGFIRKNELWRHCKTCAFKDNNEVEDENSEQKYKNIQQKSKILLMAHLKPSESRLLQEVVASMKSDEVTMAAKNDELIMKYGANTVEKLGGDRLHEVSQGLRQLSRLLIDLRRNHTETSLTTLKDFMKPQYFDKIIISVKNVCGFEESGKTKTVGVPSLALKLGYSLKKCMAILTGQALREKDNTLLTDQQNLEKLMDSEWNDRISHHSLTTLHGRKFNQIDLLPLTEDLEKLRKHLLQRISVLMKALKENATLHRWGQLAETTMTRLIIFNKRRGGEAFKMLLTNFQTRPDWKQCSSTAIESSLQPIERELCKRLDMVEILGKRGRKVPVLLTKEIKDAMQLLVDKREVVHINPRNQYFFATPNATSLTHLRHWECLQKLAKTEGLNLKNPETITSTRLRKYIATVSQVLDLQEKELDWLARHMGHDIQVHREYYRLHESTLELAKVSKILAVVDKGSISEYIGKPLDEIDVDLNNKPWKMSERVKGGTAGEKSKS